MGIITGVGTISLLFGIVLIIRDWLINFSKYEFIDIGIGFPINVFLLNISLGFLFMLIGIILYVIVRFAFFGGHYSESGT